MHACMTDWASRYIEAMVSVGAVERDGIGLLFEELTCEFTGEYHGLHIPIFFFSIDYSTSMALTNRKDQSS